MSKIKNRCGKSIGRKHRTTRNNNFKDWPVEVIAVIIYNVTHLTAFTFLSSASFGGFCEFSWHWDCCKCYITWWFLIFNLVRSLVIYSVTLRVTPQNLGVIHPMRARRLSERCDSTDRKRDALNPGKCCWALRKKSAHAHACTFLSGASPCCLYFCCVCVCRCWPPRWWRKCCHTYSVSYTQKWRARRLNAYGSGLQWVYLSSLIWLSLRRNYFLPLYAAYYTSCNTCKYSFLIVCSLCELSDWMTGAQCDS